MAGKSLFLLYILGVATLCVDALGSIPPDSAAGGTTADTVFIHSGIPPHIISRTMTSAHIGERDLYVRQYRIFPMDRHDSVQTITDTCRQQNADSVLDVNFDGYKDLMLDLDSEEPANMGQSSTVYLFNPVTRRFEYSRTFSGFSELTVNPIDSTLRSQILFLGGVGEDYQTYKVRNDAPVLIEHKHRIGDNYSREVLECGKVVVAESYSATARGKSDVWQTIKHNLRIRGALRLVEEWIAERIDDDPTPDQLANGIIKELRWGKYLVRRQTEYWRPNKLGKMVPLKKIVHEMIGRKWVRK